MYSSGHAIKEVFHLLLLYVAVETVRSDEYRFPRSYGTLSQTGTHARTSTKSCRGNHQMFFPERKGFYVFAITQVRIECRVTRNIVLEDTTKALL